LNFLTDSRYRFSRNRTGVKKFASKYVQQIGVKLWPQKKMSLVIQFTLTAYRTTTLNPCNVTLWINIRFGYFTYPLRRKRESSLNKTVGCISKEYTPRRQWRTQEFCSRGGGVQQIQLRTEDRENRDLGAVAP